MSAASWPLQRVPGLLTVHRGSFIVGLVSPKTLKGTVAWHDNIKAIGDNHNLIEETWLIVDAGSTLVIPVGYGSIAVGLDSQRPTKAVATKKSARQGHGGQRQNATGSKEFCAASFLPMLPSQLDVQLDPWLAGECSSWLISHRDVMPASLKQFPAWKVWLQKLSTLAESAEEVLEQMVVALEPGKSGKSQETASGAAKDGAVAHSDDEDGATKSPL